MSESFLLDAESLCSKWGFGDGYALDEWWWEAYDEAPSFEIDNLLHALVLAYLVPAMRLRGVEAEVELIRTVHNPVRARRLNGVEVNHYKLGGRFELDIQVEVSRQQIEDMARRTVLTVVSTRMHDSSHKTA